MELYIEYVIIDNCVMDSFLMKLLEITLKDRIKIINKILLCIIGTILALILPYLYVWRLWAFVYKIISSIILVLCIKKYKSYRNFFTYYILFVSYTFLVGGTIIGIINILSIEYTMSSLVINNIDYPMGVLICILWGTVGAIKRILGLIKQKLKTSNYKYHIQILNNGCKIGCTALFDSGNCITYNNEGVAIISIEIFLKLFKDIDIQKIIMQKQHESTLKDQRYITISGVGGEEKYLSFVIDSIWVEGRKFDNTRVAVVMKNFGDFDCILHKDYVEGV